VTASRDGASSVAGGRGVDAALTLNARLYGTGEAPAEVRHLRAGQLSAMLHAGALRGIAVGGREAVRGIGFVVRDENWGTCLPEIADLEITEENGGFRVRYSAVCRNGAASLAYRADIRATADGVLKFRVLATPSGDFLTSRTGFVVLHPVDGVAGKPVTVTHTDGSIEQTAFPATIMPSQPFFDIRSLAHDVVNGCTVTCTMEGDAYEMEDQRNWTDASYKTYIRPLSKPHPYRLTAGATVEQRVEVRVSGTVPEGPVRGRDDAVDVTVGEDPAGRVPEFALAVDPDHVESARLSAGLVRQAGIDALFCAFDASAGHDAETLAAFRRLSEATRTRLVLELTLPLRDTAGEYTDDPGVLAADVEVVRQAAADAGAEPAVVSVSPAAYRKSFQPGGEWPAVPPLESVYGAVRRAFPKARIAGGMHSYFTELNRHRPPVDAIDIITHSTSPIVHAADDLSVMQTLECLPWVFRSVRAFAPAMPYWIGPTAIGMRFNPYGASTAPNPARRRVAMAEEDPRQRGQFNAAWTLGYAARAAQGGVDGLCLSAAAGPFAVSETCTPGLEPERSAGVFPVYHVIAGLARRAGAIARTALVSDTAAVAALAIDDGAHRALWLGNLTAHPRRIRVSGFGRDGMIETLDAGTSAEFGGVPDAFARTAYRARIDAVEISPYGVLRVTPS